MYAAPQKIITITAKTEEELIDVIKNNSKKIVKEFKDSDLITVQRNILKKVMVRNILVSWTKLSIRTNQILTRQFG